MERLGKTKRKARRVGDGTRCNSRPGALFLGPGSAGTRLPVMRTTRPCWGVLLALSLLILSLAGCAALREVSNLRKVNFRIDRVSQAQLAGVEIASIQSYEDLGPRGILRLGSALSKGNLPLSFDLHLRATNPESNTVNARLTKMDWTLLLEDKETVSGLFNQEVVLPPGEPTDVSFRIELDLVRFFDENLKDLVNLASTISGDAPPQTIKLRVQPTVNTRFGPFQYPSPITVVSKDVSGSNQQP